MELYLAGHFILTAIAIFAIALFSGMEAGSKHQA